MLRLTQNSGKVTLKITTFALILMHSTQVFARNHIQIVGSSTVYPFTTVIAEEFSLKHKFKTPIVESTGTGGGIKLFCSGIGQQYPDFVNASRAIKDSEIAKCNENGIKSIIEIKIGYDAIVLANSTKSKKLNVTQEQIFLALANKIPQNGKLVANFYNKWSDIDKSLPNIEIMVYGPPPTSGTRDAFAELVMDKSCVHLNEFVAAYPDEKKRAKACQNIRSDGKYIEAGENDNLIIQKLEGNKDAFGIFGYSFLEENIANIQGSIINGFEPAFDNITSGKYPVSRPLFIYFKKEHLNLVKGIKEFIAEIVDADTLSEDGYLAEKSLIPMTKAEYKRVSKEVLRKLNTSGYL